MPAVHEYEGFYAIHDHMPGSDDVLRVGGTVVFRSGGWSAELRLHEKKGPTGINPFILYVDLVLTPPPGGVGTDALTPVELTELRVERPTIEYDEVHFVLVGAEEDDSPPTSIKVEHPR